MHPKFQKARAAAGWHQHGRGEFRMPDPTRPTGPMQEPMCALYSAALVYLLDHPDYRESAYAILEMGVTTGQVRKRVRPDGSIRYTFGHFAANRHTKRG